MQECVISVIIRNGGKNSIGSLLPKQVGLFFLTLGSENHFITRNVFLPNWEPGMVLADQLHNCYTCLFQDQ